MEFLAFGKEYASKVVSDAKKLAEELYNCGVDVLGRNKGFTMSHQVIFRAPNGNGDGAAKRLEEANIVTTKTPLPSDKTEEDCSGVRLGTQEITRIGMGDKEMVKIARLIKRVLLDREDPLKVREEAIKLAKSFRGIKYSFDGGPAYEFLEFS